MRRTRALLIAFACTAGCGDPIVAPFAPAQHDLSFAGDLAMPGGAPGDMAARDGGAPGSTDMATSNSPVVFVDQYGPGVAFQGFGGATNSVTIDSATQRGGHSSLKVIVPTSGYTGGSFVAAPARDLSGYDAVTFWAMATTAATIDKFGLGNDNAAAQWAAELPSVALSTSWTKYTVPIPVPARATSMPGVFHFATGSTASGYTFWLNDIQYEKLGSAISPTSAAIASQTLTKQVGGTAMVTGGSAVFNVNGTAETLATVAPAYFTFTSSAPSVASVSAGGVVTALMNGSATITAQLGALAATGSITLTVATVATPSTTATAPTLPAGNVISLFGAGYTAHAVDNWRASWSDSRTTLTDPYNIGAHAVKQYQSLYFVGVEFIGTNNANEIDATAMTALHLDVWTPDITQLKIKLVDFAPSGAYNPSTNQSAELTFNAGSSPALAQAQWVGLEIPFTAFVGVNASFTRAHLAQLVISDGTGGGTVYVDNVYFHN